MHKRLLNKVIVLFILVGLFIVIVPSEAQDNVQCDLKDASAFISRANAANDEGDYLRAIDDFNCALELDASNTDALFGRAYAYDLSGDDDRAEREYTNLLEIDPENGAAYNNRGNIYYAQGDLEHAKADYDRAIEYDTADTYIPLSNRGSLLYDQENYEAALADLNQAIELEPGYRSSYLTRAFVYKAMGDEKKAHNDIERWIDKGETKRIDLDLTTFESGSTLDMSEGWVYHIPIEAEAGQTVRVAAKSEGERIVDSMIVLLDGDGAPLAWNDDTEGSLDSLLKYKFDEGGSYELLVTHAGGGSEGEFRLLLEVVSKAS